VKKQAELAFEEIDKALAIEPDNADAHFQRGRIHSLRYEKDEARRNYDLAIRGGPWRAPTWSGRSWIARTSWCSGPRG
jgi:Tfp pilus assembly protein PilF